MAIAALRRVFCRRPRRRSAGGFVRDDDGNTIVEFALVAPLFFTALLAIFEVSIMFGTSVLLEAAANKAARAVRTGQVFTGSLPALNEGVQRTLFEDAMCSEIIFMKCEDLSYDVQVYPDFASANATVFCDTDGSILAPNFDVGLPGQIVVITVVFPYRPVIPNPMLYAGRDWKSAAEGGCNGLSMLSVMVFQNEPFPLTL